MTILAGPIRLPPPIIYSALKVLDPVGDTTVLRDRLEWNAKHFRDKAVAAFIKVSASLAVVSGGTAASAPNRQTIISLDSWDTSRTSR
jgi:hypothetical protein